MAKPAITLRSTKGAALTYAELDTNFTNVKDATITLTGGSGGTAVTADLNGTITLVAGSNVTITGNNTAKTITITSAGSSGLAIDGTSGDYELAADLDLNGYSIRSNGTNINVDDDINFPSGAGPNVPSGGTLLCRGGIIEFETTGSPGLYLSGTAATSGTPSNSSTPTGYVRIYINGATRFIPYFT
jgi:hypothetical protein